MVAPVPEVPAIEARGRIDDDVFQPAERRVGAAHEAAEIESHRPTVRARARTVLVRNG